MIENHEFPMLDLAYENKYIWDFVDIMGSDSTILRKSENSQKILDRSGACAVMNTLIFMPLGPARI